MGHSQAAKAESRERIITEAARQIRRSGLEALSVGALMKSVGLTHGGFYGHFESRSELVREALQRALDDGAARSKESPIGVSGSVADIARSYLSRAHRDSAETGCAIAALAGDVGRADDASRRLMEPRVKAFIDSVAGSLGGDDRQAMVAVSAMVGALTLSRVVTDRETSDAILRAVINHVAAMARDGSADAGA